MLEFWRNAFAKEPKEKRAAEALVEDSGGGDTGCEPARERPMAPLAAPREELGDQAAPQSTPVLPREQDPGAATTDPVVVGADSAGSASPTPAAAEVSHTAEECARLDDDSAAAGEPASLFAKPWQANLRARRRGQRLVKPESRPAPLTGRQRLLLLDTWRRSGLPAGDFAALVGMSRHTLYAWKKAFDRDGPAGLLEKRRGPRRETMTETRGYLRARGKRIRNRAPWSGSDSMWSSAW